jgi:hypothetical protein
MSIHTYTVVLMYEERATTAAKAYKNLRQRLQWQGMSAIVEPDASLVIEVEPGFVKRFLTLGYPHGTKLVDGQPVAQEPPEKKRRKHIGG